MTVNVLQWNARGGLGRGGLQELGRWMMGRNMRVGLIQEPGVDFEKTAAGWNGRVFQRGRAAVILTPGLRGTVDRARSCVATDVGGDGGGGSSGSSAGIDMVTVSVEGLYPGCVVTLMSYYRPHSAYPPHAVHKIQEALLALPRIDIVAGGDMNIHSERLGAQHTSTGGVQLNHLITQLEMDGGGCLNDGRPTWIGRPGDERVRTPSPIDVTLHVWGAPRLVHATGWHLHTRGTSDHRRISIQLECPAVTTTTTNNGSSSPSASQSTYANADATSVCTCT